LAEVVQLDLLFNLLELVVQLVLFLVQELQLLVLLVVVAVVVLTKMEQQVVLAVVEAAHKVGTDLVAQETREVTLQ
jgi:hypothetical protein